MFGDLEINVANQFHEPDFPEVMVLSNMTQDGKPVGLGDAGQGWHTDMSYSRDIALANVLYAIRVPVRDGRPLGDTQFRNMHLAYEDLPADIKRRLAGRTATHDFAKFWDMMRSAARLAARTAHAAAARQEAAGVAADLSHPSDHWPHHPLLQSGLCGAHRRLAGGRERRTPRRSCSGTRSSRSTSTPIAGRKAMC